MLDDDDNDVPALREPALTRAMTRRTRMSIVGYDDNTGCKTTMPSRSIAATPCIM